MKKKTIKIGCEFRWLTAALMIIILALFHSQPAQALPSSDTYNPVPAAAMKLIQYCSDPRVGLDSQAIATLVDYVLGPKRMREMELPVFSKATGAYYEFDTKVDFSSFLKYSYNAQVPSSLTSPASMRYARWTSLKGKSQKLPNIWEMASSDRKPVVVNGLECVCITPDPNTGMYNSYNQKKTLILLKYKERQVLIAISKQIDVSDVGKRGLILGNDDDWNYFYSSEAGSPKTGLGWVKSYMYDLFSVGVYVQTGSSQSLVRAGLFQWVRAGWSGINFVQTKHLISGMKRYAKNFKTVLESPRLPELNQIMSTYQRLLALPQNDLVKKYGVLQQARQRLAVQRSKVDIKNQSPYSNTPKEQIVEELMLEYLKITLGKHSFLTSNDI